MLKARVQVLCWITVWLASELSVQAADSARFELFSKCVMEPHLNKMERNCQIRLNAVKGGRNRCYGFLMASFLVMHSKGYKTQHYEPRRKGHHYVDGHHLFLKKGWRHKNNKSADRMHRHALHMGYLEADNNLEDVTSERVRSLPEPIAQNERAVGIEPANENDWEVLFDGNLLKKVIKEGDGKRFPTLDSNVTIEFAFRNLKGDLLTDNQKMNISMLLFPLADAAESMRNILMTMRNSERSTFLLSPSFHTLSGMQLGAVIIGEKDWLQFDVTLCNFLGANETMIGIGPNSDLSWIPEEEETGLKPEEEVQLKADALTAQLEYEMSTNPASQSWQDIESNLSAPHRKNIDKFFKKNLNLDKPEDPSSDGSRGYIESFAEIGTKHGYHLGNRLEGRGKSYVWRETPYLMEIALPVHNGIRAQHVHCEFSPSEIKVFLVGKMVLGGELTDTIEVDGSSVWTMNDAATKISPLSASELTEDAVSLVETTVDDSFASFANRPCICILLHKKRHVLWGNAFETI